MPRPLNAGKLEERKLSDYYDFCYMSFGKPGEKATSETPIPAGATNALGEVPDSYWYTNRHGRKRMSIEESFVARATRILLRWKDIGE